MSTPAAISQPDLTLIGRKNILTVTPNGGSAAHYIVRQLQFQPTRGSFIERKVPGADGLLYIDRVVPKERKDALVATFDEYPEVLINLLQASSGLCTIAPYAVDPGYEGIFGNSMLFLRPTSDLSNPITAMAELDGDFTFEMEADKMSQYAIKFTLTEPVEYLPCKRLFHVIGDVDGSFEFSYSAAGTGTVCKQFRGGVVAATAEGDTIALSVDDATDDCWIISNAGLLQTITVGDPANLLALNINLTGLPALSAITVITTTAIAITTLLAGPSNKLLATVDISGATITAAAMRQFCNSLPDRTGATAGSLNLENTGGGFTSADYAVAVAKNWTITD
jgi:hypothetical protein